MNNKLTRFILFTVLYIVLWTIGFTLIPLIIKIFGGNFYEVCQHPGYIMIYCIFGTIFWGCVFSEGIDEDFRVKD